MKKLLVICGALALLCSSCSSVWNEKEEVAIHQSCMEDARTWAGSETLAKQYCDCAVPKIMDRYPNLNDAMDHYPDSVIHDPGLVACRTAIGK